MMAALLVLLLLLAVPPTAFTTTDVYYVTADDSAGHEQSCPPHQMCNNLSYYISQPDSYFTNDTAIIFLEGEHSFDREDRVLVSNVHNLTLKGQGQWPVAGAEETVMQSTVIINCTEERGWFHFYNSHNITVEGLTVVNCGGLNNAVFNFSTVQSLFFHKNSIQHLTGYGLFVVNSDNVIITNCSYYHSTVCDSSGGAVGIEYDTQYSNTGYTLELSHSNMTKCCNDYIGGGGGVGGGLFLATYQEFVKAKLNVLFNHLKLSHNKAFSGGGLAASLYGNGHVTLVISNCVLFNGSAMDYGGGLWLSVAIQSAVITIESTDFVDNHSSDIYFVGTLLSAPVNITFFMLNSNVQSEQHSTVAGVYVYTEGCCASVQLTNTNMRFANKSIGFKLVGDNVNNARIQIDSCQFIGSYAVTVIVYLEQVEAKITNSIFSNNTSDANGGSVITLHNIGIRYIIPIHSCIISGNNNMTGITIIDTNAVFSGCNVIQNNRNTEGAGITLYSTDCIYVRGELLLYNNTADKHGGAILVKQPSIQAQRNQFLLCTLTFEEPSSSVTFSGNRAGKGGSDMYGAILMGCQDYDGLSVSHVGRPNETSWYFDTPLMKHLHFSNTDRLSSMSSDPIMVCFCNTTSSLPDCSDRTHHMKTYPGLEINTSIATVGYYGGTSPGYVFM